MIRIIPIITPEICTIPNPGLIPMPIKSVIKEITRIIIPTMSKVFLFMSTPFLGLILLKSKFNKITRPNNKYFLL